MHKSGFVNIIGKPNVGKSTLMNVLVGERMSIITHKPQTTRHRILGIVNDDDYQIIFSDSPWIIEKSSYKMQEKMNRFAYSSFEDADIILYMVDVVDPTPPDEKLLLRLNGQKVPVFLLLNKVDKIEAEELESIQLKWRETLPTATIYPISARDKSGLDGLIPDILVHLPEGPEYFPKDQFTDRPMRFFVSEIIREKILLLYRQEIPYSCEVVVESYQEPDPAQKSKFTRIEAIIYVARKSQKNIMIGHRGEAITELGKQSRLAIEKFIECPVFLQLFIKVKEDWRDDERALKNFGYQAD